VNLVAQHSGPPRTRLSWLYAAHTTSGDLLKYTFPILAPNSKSSLIKGVWQKRQCFTWRHNSNDRQVVVTKQKFRVTGFAVARRRLMAKRSRRPSNNNGQSVNQLETFSHKPRVNQLESKKWKYETKLCCNKMQEVKIRNQTLLQQGTRHRLLLVSQGKKYTKRENFTYYAWCATLDTTSWMKRQGASKELKENFKLRLVATYNFAHWFLAASVLCRWQKK